MELSNQEVREVIQKRRQKVVFKGVIVQLPEINQMNKTLRQRGFTISFPNLPRIVELTEKQKIILLNSQADAEALAKQFEHIRIGEVEEELSYRNFESQQILNWFTKSSDQNDDEFIPFPGSFETIGHIAHYNLTEGQTRWRTVIGQITLLKCPNIKTVVNKTEKLHNVYRTPTLQHMAGTQEYEASLKERGVEFRINFQKVYWCSRLQQERDRLLELMRPGEVLVDLFCGVGPLAVRAAKKNLFVIANDLNPYCHEYLEKNCLINKVDARVLCWNMCAREAMKKLYAEKSNLPIDFRSPDHIYMNLPVDAIEFLDVLEDYEKRLKTKKMPQVHVNCFVVADSDQKSKELLAARIKKVFPSFEASLISHLHHIKNVTVIMRMYCLSFSLPSSLQKQQLEESQNEEKLGEEQCEKGHKKQKIN